MSLLSILTNHACGGAKLICSEQLISSVFLIPPKNYWSIKNCKYRCKAIFFMQKNKYIYYFIREGGFNSLYLPNGRGFIEYNNPRRPFFPNKQNFTKILTNPWTVGNNKNSKVKHFIKKSVIPLMNVTVFIANKQYII